MAPLPQLGGGFLTCTLSPPFLGCSTPAWPLVLCPLTSWKCPPGLTHLCPLTWKSNPLRVTPPTCCLESNPFLKALLEFHLLHGACPSHLSLNGSPLSLRRTLCPQLGLTSFVYLTNICWTASMHWINTTLRVGDTVMDGTQSFLPSEVLCTGRLGLTVLSTPQKVLRIESHVLNWLTNEVIISFVQCHTEFESTLQMTLLNKPKLNVERREIHFILMKNNMWLFSVSNAESWFYQTHLRETPWPSSQTAVVNISASCSEPVESQSLTCEMPILFSHLGMETESWGYLCLDSQGDDWGRTGT